MKTAWVFSGGGAKGAYQSGIMNELQANNVVDIGRNPGYVAGISVGSLNGLAAACDEIPTVTQIWQTISNDDIYRYRGVVSTAARYRLSERTGFVAPPMGLYDMSPLMDLLEKHTKGTKGKGKGWTIKIPLVVGVVNIESGEYKTVLFKPGTEVDDDVLEVIKASCAIPVTFDVVNVKDNRYIPDGLYVDGGLKHITPLSAIVGFNPDKVMIVICDRYKNRDSLISGSVKNILDVARSSISALVGNNFMSDLDKYFWRNELARAMGSPVEFGDKILKYYPTIFIEPNRHLGGSMDFSADKGRERVREGAKMVTNNMIKQMKQE